MIYRTNKQLENARLTQPTYEKLTYEELLKSFTKEQIANSTYILNGVKTIRLMNRYEAKADIPGLYNYSLEHIKTLQTKYSNVHGFIANSATKEPNVKLDATYLSNQDNQSIEGIK